MWPDRAKGPFCSLLPILLLCVPWSGFINVMFNWPLCNTCILLFCLWLTYNRQALSDAKRAVYLNPEWEKVCCSGCTFFFIKRHSVYPPVSMVVSKKNPKLVCAIFMVKNGKNLFQSNGLELTGVTVMNGILVHCKYTMKAAHPSQHLSGFQRQLSPVPISSPGLRETLSELHQVPRKKTWGCWQGIEIRPLHPSSNALTIRPVHLPDYM